MLDFITLFSFGRLDLGWTKTGVGQTEKQKSYINQWLSTFLGWTEMPHRARVSILCIVRTMKRLNPQTGNPFRLGDTREDGRVFYGYTKRVKYSGYFVEIWIRQESRQAIRLKDLERKKQRHVS